MNALDNAKRSIRRPLVHYILIVLLAVCIYSNTLSNGFVFDDLPYIVENPAIKDFSYFTDPSRIEKIGQYDIREFFQTRVVGFFTFALNYKIHGLDPRGYHLFNVVVHAANSLLVYFLIVLLSNGKHRMAALSIALLFAAHPIQTQAVAYISQRLASLCAMFYLLAVLLYVKSRLAEGRWKYAFYVLSVMSTVLAMKTKEIAFTIPLAMAMIEMMFLKGRLKERALSLTPLGLTMLIIPLTLISRMSGEAFTMAAKGKITSGDYLITEFRVIVTYMRLMILPINQNNDYDYPVYKTMAEPAILLSMLLIFAVIGFAVWLFIRSKREDNPDYRFISFGIFWFFLTLSVESSFIPIVDVIFEHRLYLPSAGFIAAVVFGARIGLSKIKHGQTVAAAAMVLIVIVFGFMAYSRNKVWQSELSLWSDAVMKSPNKARPHYNLGWALKMEKRIDEAEREFGRSLDINPNHSESLNNLANITLMKGDIVSAKQYYIRAIESDKDNIEAIYNLAKLYEWLGENDKAVMLYMEFIKNVKPPYESLVPEVRNRIDALSAAH